MVVQCSSRAEGDAFARSNEKRISLGQEPQRIKATAPPETIFLVSSVYLERQFFTSSTDSKDAWAFAMINTVRISGNGMCSKILAAHSPIISKSALPVAFWKFKCSFSA